MNHPTTPFDAASRAMLQHFLASIAYRTQKVLRGAPDNHGELGYKPIATFVGMFLSEG